MVARRRKWGHVEDTIAMDNFAAAGGAARRGLDGGVARAGVADQRALSLSPKRPLSGFWPPNFTLETARGQTISLSELVEFRRQPRPAGNFELLGQLVCSLPSRDAQFAAGQREVQRPYRPLWA